MKPPLSELDFQQLIENGTWVRGLARQLLYDKSLTDDVVQEVWIAALRHPPDRPESLRAWLSRVVRTLSLRAKRSQSRGSGQQSDRRDRCDRHRDLRVSRVSPR